MSNAAFESQFHMLLVLLTEHSTYLSCMLCCLHVLARTLCLVSEEPAARHAPGATSAEPAARAGRAVEPAARHALTI